MTLWLRNVIIVLGILVSSAALTFSVYTMSLFNGSFAGLAALVGRQATWSATVPWIDGADGLLLELSAATGAVALAVVGGIVYAKSFRTAGSSEVFFFSVWLVSLAVEACKIGQVFLVVDGYAVFWRILVSRVYYFGRMVGVLSLFAAALYAAGTQYQKLGTVLGMVLVVAFLTSYLVPIDGTVLGRNLVHPVSGSPEVRLVTGTVQVLTVVSYAAGAALSKSSDGYVSALAVGLVILGREFVHTFPGPLFSAIGVGLMVVGVVVFGVRNYRAFLWT